MRPFTETSTEDLTKEINLVRKLDRRIMPIICLLYLFACRSFISLRVSHESWTIYLSMQFWTGRTLAMPVCKVYQKMLSEVIRQEICSAGSTPHFFSHM